NRGSTPLRDTIFKHISFDKKILSVLKNGYFIEVISSLTIWKADKIIFKIICKVLKVFLMEYN
ncbi:hypothetical protein CGJ08_24770, partial [Vibrio parahaemolyticus]|uniref:hypothetical protein n=1 Tax=Vibrio parahaemolyticus TaxID=670 RepID=UPI001171FDF7